MSIICLFISATPIYPSNPPEPQVSPAPVLPSKPQPLPTEPDAEISKSLYPLLLSVPKNRCLQVV